MTDLTYLQAAVIGLVQGVSELFPFPASAMPCSSPR